MNPDERTLTPRNKSYPERNKSVFVCHLCGRRKRRFSDTEICWTIFEISRGPLPSLWEKQEISVFKTPLRSDFEIFQCFRWKSHSLYRLSVDEVSYCRGQLLMGPSSRRRLPYFSPLIQSRIRRTRWTDPVYEWNFTMQLLKDLPTSLRSCHSKPAVT